MNFPVEGNPVTCGLRTDLPRKHRRHAWEDLGDDFTNKGEQGIVQVPVQACTACGKDKR